MRAERKDHSLLVRLYVTAVVGAAIALAAAILSRWGAPDYRQATFFLVLASFANVIGRVEVPLGGLSLVEEDKARGIPLAPGFIVLVTAAYVSSPSTAIAVASVSAASEIFVPESRHILKLLFNRSQEVLYVGAAAVSYASLRSAVPGVRGGFIAAASAAFVAVVLNHSLVGGVVALDRRVPLREVARRMAWPAPLSLGFGLVALLIATLYSELGAPSALFLFMPLTALRVVREAKMSLDAAVQRTITDFARAVDEKDPYTYRHSDRVAMIAVELHRELGTRSKQIERRWSGAVLHDIGKVAVPATILRKAGPLTVEEYDAIKTHPTVGADVLQRIDLFSELAPEVRHHHERLDGTGYPDGLSGNDIPFAARVLAVADAFDALTSDRPYRAALSDDEALEELLRSAGTQHDPTVVDALARVLNRGFAFVRTEQRDRGTQHARIHAIRSA